MAIRGHFLINRGPTATLKLLPVRDLEIVGLIDVVGPEQASPFQGGVGIQFGDRVLLVMDLLCLEDTCMQPYREDNCIILCETAGEKGQGSDLFGLVVTSLRV